MDKYKVLIVAGAMNVGGIENQLMHLLRQAGKNQFQIDFTTTEDHPFYKDEMLALGAQCIRIPKTEGIHFLRYCRALFRVMREGGYDIVHSHELFHSGMVLLTARLAGVKHRFVHAHNWSDGDGSGRKRSWKRSVYNHVMQRLIQWNATDFVACSTLAGKFLYADCELVILPAVEYSGSKVEKIIRRLPLTAAWRKWEYKGEFNDADYLYIRQVYDGKDCCQIAQDIRKYAKERCDMQVTMQPVVEWLTQQ